MGTFTSADYTSTKEKLIDVYMWLNFLMHGTLCVQRIIGQMKNNSRLYQ